MQRLKRAALVLIVLAMAGFVAFLYFVPPLLSLAPETFSGPQNDAAPPVTSSADPAERLIAERGRDLVVTSGCIGCHQVPTPQGPDFSRYLAGGLTFQNAGPCDGSRHTQRRRGEAGDRERRVPRRSRGVVSPHAVGRLHGVDGGGSPCRGGVSAPPEPCGARHP